VLATGIRFYLDENLPIAIAAQLKRRGIEVTTARDLNFLGQSDDNHLRQATEMGYVLCTNDADFVELDARSIEHAGIVFGQQHKHGIGDWVRYLELIHAVFEPKDMWNNVEYL
jgi:hypothetical protein